MKVEMRRIRLALTRAGALVGALWAFAGCGGSGSSGFDIAPGGEAQAISDAIDGQQCVIFNRQQYCASGVPAPSGAFTGASIAILPPDGPLVCDPATSSEACTASLAVVPAGFHIVNSTLAAIAESEDGPWMLTPLSAGDDLEGSDTVTITVSQENGATTKPVIAAVLVYRGVLRPETVAQTTEQLAEFGADVVYVSPRLEVVVPR
jgi:hypothetical protein